MKKKLLSVLAALLFVSAVFAQTEKNYSGGKPWINSVIKENVMKAQRTS